MKTTFVSATLYGRTNYLCKVTGDEQIQHWGVKFDKWEPATIHISCFEKAEEEYQNLAS